MLQAIGTGVARKMLSGFITRACCDWSFSEFEDCANKESGLYELFQLQPEWHKQLTSLSQKFPQLTNVSTTEFVQWVEAGNPELANQIASSPLVMSWLVKAWTNGRETLFGT